MVLEIIYTVLLILLMRRVTSEHLILQRFSLFKCQGCIWSPWSYGKCQGLKEGVSCTVVRLDAPQHGEAKREPQRLEIGFLSVYTDGLWKKSGDTVFHRRRALELGWRLGLY